MQTSHRKSEMKENSGNTQQIKQHLRREKMLLLDDPISDLAGPVTNGES